MTAQLPEQIRAAIESEVDKLIRETEASTVSLGGSLRSIVDEAEQFITEIQRQVGGLDSRGEAGVTGALEEQTRTVSDFVAGLSGSVADQERLVAKVSETSDVVSEAAASVAAISLQSRMLSLNTMIEANRLGALGRPFMVIAKEMRELAESIAASNQQISRLTGDLLPLVSQIETNLEALGGEARRFGERFDEQKERIGNVTRHLQDLVGSIQRLGDQRLAKIVERSNSSLVDLQMQDILSQRLRRLLCLATGKCDEPSMALSGKARQGGASVGELLARGEATQGFLSDSLEPAGGLTAGEMELF